MQFQIGCLGLGFTENVKTEQTTQAKEVAGWKGFLSSENSKFKAPEARWGQGGDRGGLFRAFSAMGRTPAFTPSDMGAVESSEQGKDMTWLRCSVVSSGCCEAID